MPILRVLLVLVLVGLYGMPSDGLGQQPPQTEPVTVHLISVAGPVEPSMAAYLRRALRDLPQDPAPHVILEIDTFGGRVDAALDMVETLLDESSGRTVAYVETKAISAGALIALACDQLVMRRNTTLGDCAPISYTSEGPQELGEKFQSPLRAKFRALARRNGYPEALAEAMVTQGMEVLEVTVDGEKRYLQSRELDSWSEAERARITSQRVVVGTEELLTMTADEARELGFSRHVVSDLEEALELLYGGSVTLRRIEKSWSERLVGLIGSVAPLLMLIGLAALYTEIKSPGFGVPGIVGLACLATVLLSQHLVGLADYTELLLLAAGLILLGFELFVIPGFGIAGFAGILLIAVGLMLSLQGFVVPDPSRPWQQDLLIRNALLVTLSTLGAVLLTLAMLRFVLPRISRVVEGPYLDATLLQARNTGRDASGVRPGDKGTAQTALRPSGKMRRGTQLLDVLAAGEFIPRGEAVRVVEVRGNVIIVAREDAHGS